MKRAGVAPMQWIRQASHLRLLHMPSAYPTEGRCDRLCA